MNDTGHHHHDAVNQPEPQWKRNASKNGGRVAKKKYHPKRLEERFHRKGHIEVEFCRACRKKFLGYLDEKSALGKDGRMYGEGRA